MAAPASGLRVVAAPYTDVKPEGWTRFVCFSDTHGKLEDVPEEHCPRADVLLHAGDFTMTGQLKQVASLVEWLRHYPAEQKVVIAGNHDITLDVDFYKANGARFHGKAYEPDYLAEVHAVLANSGVCTYLENATTEVAGYKIFGSPHQPEFGGWAFPLPEDLADCAAVWEKIPQDVHIVMAHGPAYGRGDLCSHGGRVGCPFLLRAVQARAVPVLLSGHIHEDYGIVHEGPTTVVNASTCTLRYKPTNPPIVFDLPPPQQLRPPAAAEAAEAEAP